MSIKYCPLALLFFSEEFSLFSYNNGMVMSSCRELDNNRSALSAASAFAIATAGANEGTPTKEKYRRMSLASTGTYTPTHCPLLSGCLQNMSDLQNLYFAPCCRGCFSYSDRSPR